jgi:trimethylamine--corrinoid protein Co-methyltransferase
VYLSEKHTLEWFRKEQFMPSALIDRKEWRAWKKDGSKSILQRAKEQVAKILNEHEPEPLPEDVGRDLDAAARSILNSAKAAT